MSAETVPVQENEVVEQEEAPIADPMESEEQVNEAPIPEKAIQKETQVPLSALQKERQKRQELEQELRWHKEQSMRQQPVASVQEPDESLQEPATREEVETKSKTLKRELKREISEDKWIEENPERAAELDDKLLAFLKQRPHLARAIEDAPNRYSEAWILMDALTQKQKTALKPAPVARKDTPGNPGSVPKAAAMNQSVDCMTMDDKEFNAWRKSQRKPR